MINLLIDILPGMKYNENFIGYSWGVCAEPEVVENDGLEKVENGQG